MSGEKSSLVPGGSRPAANPLPTPSGAASHRRGCGTRDSHKLWFNWEPCGMVCASVVHIVDIASLYGIHVCVLNPWLGGSMWYYFHSIVLTAIVILGLTSHLRAMLCNPGAVPTNAKPVDPANYERHCHKCNNFKPPRAHHCSVCHRCVVKMDHHCPWVNTCVGLANHKYFILFVFYIFSMAAYCLALIFTRFISCLSPAAMCDTSAGQAVGILILTITGLLFGLFTGCLFIDQVTNITTNTTQIDRMKGHGAPASSSRDVDDRKQLWHNLGEVFGGDPAREGIRWTWFVPTPVTYTDAETLSGFCFRDVPKPRTQAEMEMV